MDNGLVVGGGFEQGLVLEQFALQPAFLKEEVFELFVAGGAGIAEEEVELAALALQTAAQLLLL